MHFAFKEQKVIKLHDHVFTIISYVISHCLLLVFTYIVSFYRSIDVGLLSKVYSRAEVELITCQYLSKITETTFR